MSTARSLKSLTVEDYLAGELQSEIKYEYVDGRVYVLLEHDRCAARSYVREQDGEFHETLYIEADSFISLESIAAELSFSHIYAGIEFPASE